jgi:2-polyprenyl-3-methyl-5-hydroxy-6-metoxy-1,4-benzoquinol methylase
MEVAFLQFTTDPRKLSGRAIKTNPADFSNVIAYGDHKIDFAVRHSEGKDVLDLGCVEHDPEAYRGRFWVHAALRSKALSVTGIDLEQEGVTFLNSLGFAIVHADAQNFELGKKFDVIFAGDIIEHLEDFSGFFESCKRHLRASGILLISTPNPWYWRNIVRAILYGDVKNNPEHTCWFDPRTLRQLAARHDMYVASIEFGSRYARDRYMPLPRGIKHTSWHAVVKAN